MREEYLQYPQNCTALQASNIIHRLQLNEMIASCPQKIIIAPGFQQYPQTAAKGDNCLQSPPKSTTYPGI